MPCWEVQWVWRMSGGCVCSLSVCGNTFWVRTGGGNEDNGIVLVQIDSTLVIMPLEVVSTFNILYHDGVDFGIIRHDLEAMVQSP